MSKGKRAKIFGALFATMGGGGRISLSNASTQSFTREEVSGFDGTNGKRFMVTYRGNVYDLTEFKSRHPGGNLIEQAAGNDIEQFWARWAYHFDSKMVQEVLQANKVGVIEEEEEEEEEDITKGANREEEYATEPSRDVTMHYVCSSTPFCSQTHPEVLSSSYITSTESLYVRNHAPVPKLSYDTHHIQFSSENQKNDRKRMSLKDLSKRYTPIEVISVLQCAGNRQTDDFKASGPNGFTGGVYETLQNGMVGNILWKGYRLDSILHDLYPKECNEENNNLDEDVWHVVLTGADEYETSTPLSILLDSSTDCLLAIGMNGEKLSPDHGYPIRALLPGVAGCRNVKYLESIRLSKSPSNSPWNSYYYRKADGNHIQKLPLQSIILTPTKNTKLSVENNVNENTSHHVVKVRGVAYSGGENTQIEKVEITTNDGGSWQVANILKDDEENNSNTMKIAKNHQKMSINHAWVRFEADVTIPVSTPDSKKIYIHSRATDSNGLIQPKYSPKQRGYLYNGWGKTSLKL